MSTSPEAPPPEPRPPEPQPPEAQRRETHPTEPQPPEPRVREREPIPPGAVSTIRGYWQRPALTWLTRVVLAFSVAAAVAPGPAGRWLAVAVVAAIVAAPLMRVAWLIFRWVQERDQRFVIVGSALLAVVATGAVIAAFGVGS